MKQGFKVTSFLLLILYLTECSGKGNLETIKIGKQKIKVEVANTPQEMQLGLGHRDTLPSNQGMLFVFPSEKKRVFWMKGCSTFDIDIAFIESDGTISEITTMKKEAQGTPLDSLETYHSKSEKVRYALEMLGGWFAKNDIKVGTRIDLERFKNLHSSP